MTYRVELGNDTQPGSTEVVIGVRLLYQRVYHSTPHVTISDGSPEVVAEKQFVFPAGSNQGTWRTQIRQWARTEAAKHKQVREASLIADRFIAAEGSPMVEL